MEFFWYGCPHCYALEPLLEAWIKKLPADVEFRRVPAMFNERWAIAARVYYALEAMGLARQAAPAASSTRSTRTACASPTSAQLTEWLQKKGVDVAKFAATLKSFAVESRLQARAAARAAARGSTACRR